MKCMRNLFFFAFIYILFSGSSCTPERGGFLMTYERDFTIPAGLNAINTHYFDIFNVETLKDQYFATNQVSDSSQYKANANEGRIYLPFDPEVDLSFIQDIQIMLYKPGQTGILPIAFERFEVPYTTDDQLLMLAQIPDLMSYLSDEKFNIRVRINLRSPSPQTITVRLLTSYRVLPK